jgi:hypothetical protein
LKTGGFRVIVVTSPIRGVSKESDGGAMKPTLMVIAGLFLSPSIFLGQQSGASSGTAAEQSTVQHADGNTILLTAVPENQPCPVGLQAKQGSASGLVKVRRPPDAQPETAGKTGQHIHLIVTKPGHRQSVPKVVGATVTARGLAARAHIDKASGSSGPADVRRTLNIRFAVEDEHSLSAELELPGFTTVKSIKIEVLEYADGSTRDLSGQKLCTVAPDPLMLVAGR